VDPSPKSVVLDLLSTLRSDASMPVRTLIEAAEIFGLEANGVRVALTRLRADGLVRTDERGRYRLGAGGDSVREHVASWRRVESKVRPWRGEWLAAFTAGLPRSDRTAVRNTTRALRLLGFATVERGLDMRPDNLAGGVDAVRERARVLGLDRRSIVVVASALESELTSRVGRLWDVASLAKSYRACTDELAQSTSRLRELLARAENGGSEVAGRRALRDAMRESFVVGGRAIRLIVRDPLLPDEIFPCGHRVELAQALRDYDRLGRACWRPFMRAHGVVADRAPGTMRPLEAAGAAAI